jgi:hypothetical protein
MSVREGLVHNTKKEYILHLHQHVIIISKKWLSDRDDYSILTVFVIIYVRLSNGLILYAGGLSQ